LEAIAFADYLGQVTVVNAWASWCAPCVEETPELIATQKATKDLGVAFLGLNVTDDLESAREFAREITYLSTLIIDRNSMIAVRIIGPITQEVLTALITEIIDENI